MEVIHGHRLGDDAAAPGFRHAALPQAAPDIVAQLLLVLGADFGAIDAVEALAGEQVKLTPGDAAAYIRTTLENNNGPIILEK